MALLDEVSRLKIWRGFMRYLSGVEPMAYTKDELKAAIDATDAWQDANQAAYVAALPVAFRDNSTATQKVLLFCAVALMRYSENILRKVFGEVD